MRRCSLPGVSVEELRQLVGRLGTQAEALAALGAAIRLRAGGTEAHADVQACLEDVLEELGVAQTLRAADPDRLAPVLSAIQALVLQALDLLTDPARAPGWSYADPAVLESQGQASAQLAEIIRDRVAPDLPGLGERLAQPGAAFLDVGVGVGALSIGMCRLWPGLDAVGIDPWDPALALARRHVAAADLAGRIELRHQGVEELDDLEAFDLVFLPGPSLPRHVLERSLERVRTALRPGGWVLLGLYRGAEDLASALARLRTVRSGGSLLSGDEAAHLLAGAGFEDVRAVVGDVGIPAVLVAGRRAA